tara:strand:+ start:312 stop:581 length:270 start_codon:yes stop_codon:yes gene_type:complete
MENIILIDFENQIGNCKATKQNYLVYGLQNSKKYGAAVYNWNSRFRDIVNLKTGLKIGYFNKESKKFTRRWGFKKESGRDGRVRISVQN